MRSKTGIAKDRWTDKPIFECKEKSSIAVRSIGPPQIMLFPRPSQIGLSVHRKSRFFWKESHYLTNSRWKLSRDDFVPACLKLTNGGGK
jgi:hypothetical protein